LVVSTTIDKVNQQCRRSRNRGGVHLPSQTVGGRFAQLPLYAMCDRWDIGGLSTPWHWQTDAASIFVYDGYPGGIGLASRWYPPRWPRGRWA
jgi:hypothetical protein